MTIDFLDVARIRCSQNANKMLIKLGKFKDNEMLTLEL